MPGDDSRSMRVAGVQWRPSPDPESNLRQMATRIADAADQGAALVVFPEYSFRHLSPPEPSWTAQHTTLDGPWVAALADHAASNGVTVVAGISETSESGKPYNTQVVVDADGVRGAFRKIHLYDAFSTKESDLFSAALEHPVHPVTVGGMVLGAQTCYDLRFPEVTRRFVDAGSEVVVMPSQWVPGPHKVDQWRTLVIARAIEAQVWMVAVDHPAPTGVGVSMVVSPRGVIVAEAGSGEDMIIADIDASEVEKVRAENPMAQARRFRVDWG